LQESGGGVYTGDMEMTVEFLDSAFNHQFTKEDILWAIETFVYEERISETQDKYVLVGFSRAGNPMEIMFNQVDEDTVEVFHAMDCRPQWRKKAGV
jgi:hypothetical protein